MSNRPPTHLTNEPSRLERWVARLAFLALGLGLVGLAVWIPVRDRGTLLGSLREQPGGSYASSCASKAAAYLDDVRERRYLPQRLRVRRSNDPSRAPGAVLGETLYASLLTRRATPFSVVVARGGLGKSKLAAALEARLCDTVATFRIDVGLDLVPRLKSGTAPGLALEDVVADRAAVGEAPGARERFAKRLSDEAWVLLVDSLDEVALADRPHVVQALEELFQRYPRTVRLAVFTRPPVYAGDYGLKSVASWLSIEPLDCIASDERVRFALGSEEQVDRFRAFATATGLGARSRAPEACRYVHLATYRDLFVAVDVAKDENFVPREGFQATRAAVFGAWIDGRLRAAGLDVAAARTVLEGLVAAAGPQGGTRSFSWELGACEQLVAAAGRSDPAGECARLASSAVLKRLDERSFRFDNQSLADYFVASWADHRLVGAEGSPECARVADMAPLFEANEVVGFLSGMPNGTACVEALLRALCSVDDPGEETLATLEQGLAPATVASAAWLRAPAGGDAKATCLAAVAQRLGVGVAGSAP